VKLWTYEGAVLGVCTLAFFATMAARLVISPVVPLIGADFAVSNGALGLALTGMWFAYAASQFPSGLLADRYGERRIILVAVVGTAGASALLAVAPTYGIFLLGAVVLGGVAGLHFSVATGVLADQFGWGTAFLVLIVLQAVMLSVITYAMTTSAARRTDAVAS